MTEQTKTETVAPPFGAVYFGLVLVVVGVIAVFIEAEFLGALITISGVIVACTGMIQRSISRIGY